MYVEHMIKNDLGKDEGISTGGMKIYCIRFADEKVYFLEL